MLETDFFCVARSGPTVDGREIKPDWIDQAAASYDPAVYGARIWLEHVRSIYAESDGPFAAYGDVTAVKAVAGADGSRELHAKIAPTPELVKIKQNRQKIYWSVEITPDFAKTGTAYLTGLAVTDSPASLGTDALKFHTLPIPEMMMSQPAPVAASPAAASPSAVSPPADGESPSEASLFARLTAFFAKTETAVETAAASAASAATAVTLTEKSNDDRDAAVMLLAQTLRDSGTGLEQLRKDMTEAFARLDDLSAKLNQAVSSPAPTSPITAPVAGATSGVDY